LTNRENVSFSRWSNGQWMCITSHAKAKLTWDTTIRSQYFVVACTHCTLLSLNSWLANTASCHLLTVIPYWPKQWTPTCWKFKKENMWQHCYIQQIYINIIHWSATSFRINHFTCREICVFFILLTTYLLDFWHNTINLFHVITADYELPGTVWLMAGFYFEMIFKQQTFWVSLIMHVHHYNSTGPLFYLETIFCHFLLLLHCACGW
jgi:hypothetical protein